MSNFRALLGQLVRWAWSPATPQLGNITQGLSDVVRALERIERSTRQLDFTLSGVLTDSEWVRLLRRRAAGDDDLRTSVRLALEQAVGGMANREDAVVLRERLIHVLAHLRDAEQIITPESAS